MLPQKMHAEGVRLRSKFHGFLTLFSSTQYYPHAAVMANPCSVYHNIVKIKWELLKYRAHILI